MGSDVYDGPFKSVFKALYHQRCGVELSGDFTEHPRDACHQDAVLHRRRTYPLDGEQRESIAEDSDLEEIQAVGAITMVRLRPSHEQLSIVDHLVDLYEIDPTRFQIKDLGTPMAERPMPAMISAALVAVEYFEQLQVGRGEQAGAIRGGVTPVTSIANPKSAISG